MLASHRKISGIAGLAGEVMLWWEPTIWLAKVRLAKRLWIICQTPGIGKFNYGRLKIAKRFALMTSTPMEDIRSNG
jgi:hypothetical protein